MRTKRPIAGVIKHNFKPILTSTFIETGSSNGDGIDAALRYGYQTVHSIELSELYYGRCVERFKHRKRRVHLYLGDSRMVLPEILAVINERCTFWLDAHYCGEPSSGNFEDISLMDELKIIGQHHIKNHVIMIDDIRLVRDKNSEWSKFPYTLSDIEGFIRSINPNYKIIYRHGTARNDILVAI